MSVGISEFISYFDTGARPNYFDVQIIGGSNQGGFKFKTDDGHNFRCINASFPGVELGTNEESSFGAPRQIPDGTAVRRVAMMLELPETTLRRHLKYWKETGSFNRQFVRKPYVKKLEKIKDILLDHNLLQEWAPYSLKERAHLIKV